MTAGGVIPRPEDRPNRPVIGRMEDIDGVPIEFTRNRDGTVRLSFGPSVYQRHLDQGLQVDLDHDAREEFMRLWCEAERQADDGDG